MILPIRESWTVVFAKHGFERLAATKLANIEGVKGFCPSIRRRIIRNGKVYHIIVSLFPRILFAFWDINDPNIWHDIKNSLYVKGILGGEKPCCVGGSIFENWLTEANDEWILSNIENKIVELNRGFKEGDFVLLTNGFFSGHIGCCVEVKNNFIVSVKIVLLGREVVVSLPIAWCRASV